MKISVIIPCYNAERTLLKCVTSVIQQTYPVHEIILVDDGSTDHSRAIVEDLIKTHSEHTIIYLYQQNSGPSVARNTGIQNSTGNWIAFLDADDYWMEKKLEIQQSFINKYPNITLCSTANSKMFIPKEQSHQLIHLKDLLYRNFFETSTVLVKKSSIEKVRFNENQKYSEDYRAWLSILANEEIGLYINQFLASNIYKKSTFGESGLSKNIIGIEKGEWSNFWMLYKTNKIQWFTFTKALTYSSLKFVRRWIITKLR